MLSNFTVLSNYTTKLYFTIKLLSNNYYTIKFSHLDAPSRFDLAVTAASGACPMAFDLDDKNTFKRVPP